MKFEFTSYDAGIMMASAVLFLISAFGGPVTASQIALFMVAYPIIQVIVTSVWPERKKNEE